VAWTGLGDPGYPGVDPTARVGYGLRLAIEVFRRFPAAFVRQELVNAILRAFRSEKLVRDFGRFVARAPQLGLTPADRFQLA
jgi:hypothetical protein